MANERILVVDDEPGVVRSCVRILQHQGFSVTGKTNSQSIPDVLRKETFDLLLTDIRMPKLDGLKLLQIAKEIDPHITVILITGYGTMEDAINAIRLGVQGFIMKPFEPDDLVATVRDSLARRKLIHDSLRLQMLLPLLEINQILQVSGNETSLIRKVLDIAYQKTRAARISWLNFNQSNTPFLKQPEDPTLTALREVIVMPEDKQTISYVPEEALNIALTKGHPVWVLADETLVNNLDGQPNVVSVVLPMIIKGEVGGILTAETGEGGRSGPFDQISLNLLSVLAGHLAIIIENVQLFQQIKALHAFNEDIIKTMTNGLVAINEVGTVTAFNPAAATMLGHDSDEVLYQPIQKSLSDAPSLTKLFEQTLEVGQSQAHQEITIQHWDGTRLPLSVSVAPLTTDKNNQPVGVVGVLEDLSEIKALEAERRRLDRLAALGEMSAVVAHEIRNPMAGIAAGVEYLTRNMSAESPESEGASLIQGEIKRVNRILEDILFVARPLQLNLSKENLPEIIKDVIQRCQLQIKASQIEVSSEYPDDLPPLTVDRQRLEQVFANLIINATQALKSGGELHLKTAVRSNGQASGQVVITISDNGPGIPLDAHRRIFEPFFTTKTKGTGLGLPVARRIIEEHKGTIEIDSHETKGTRFIIRLPLETGITL